MVRRGKRRGVLTRDSGRRKKIQNKNYPLTIYTFKYGCEERGVVIIGERNTLRTRAVSFLRIYTHVPLITRALCFLVFVPVIKVDISGISCVSV